MHLCSRNWCHNYRICRRTRLGRHPVLPSLARQRARGDGWRIQFHGRASERTGGARRWYQIIKPCLVVQALQGYLLLLPSSCFHWGKIQEDAAENPGGWEQVRAEQTCGIISLLRSKDGSGEIILMSPSGEPLIWWYGVHMSSKFVPKFQRGVKILVQCPGERVNFAA